MEEEQSLYAALGLQNNATDKQIHAAYKSLTLQYHPDRNPGSEEAAIKYKQICDAYAILSDNNRRRSYDLSGGKANVQDTDSVDVKNLGGLGRVFGAFYILRGISIPTSISSDVVETAKTICENGGIDGQGPPLDSRVQDLVLGWTVEGRVDRQQGVYYRIVVDEKLSNNGLIISCKSTKNDKFKILLFDSDGNVIHQEESMKCKSYSHAAFYFTQFDTFRLGEQQNGPPGSPRHDIPPALVQLDSFTNSKRSIKPGNYCLCIYGDNFINASRYAVVAVASLNDIPEVEEIKQVDESLKSQKLSLEKLKKDYQAAKDAYEATLDRIEKESETLKVLLAKREKSYSDFVTKCTKMYSPSHSSDGNLERLSVESAEGSGNSRPSSPAASSDTGASGGEGSLGGGEPKGVVGHAQAAVNLTGRVVGNTALAVKDISAGVVKRISLGTSSIFATAPKLLWGSSPNEEKTSEGGGDEVVGGRGSSVDDQGNDASTIDSPPKHQQDAVTAPPTNEAPDPTPSPSSSPSSPSETPSESVSTTDIPPPPPDADTGDEDATSSSIVPDSPDTPTASPSITTAVKGSSNNGGGNGGNGGGGGGGKKNKKKKGSEVKVDGGEEQGGGDVEGK